MAALALRSPAIPLLVLAGDWLYLDAKSGYHNRIPDWFLAAEGIEPDPEPHALFNLRDDPRQLHNLCAQEPRLTAELQALLQRLREQGHSAPRLDP